MMHRIAAFALAAVVLGDRPKSPLKKYTINLDLAPEERFKELVLDHKNYIHVVVAALRLLFSGNSAKQFLNATNPSDEHRREMEGIASALGLKYEDALMANFFYELSECTGSETMPEEWRSVVSRSCTGIVAQSSDGTVYHARNMDYPTAFAPLQYDGTFIKGGKVVFEGTSFAATVGMGGSCVVPGKWSAEINARDSNKASFKDALDHASKGWLGFPMLLRQGCEHGGDFEAGLKYLSETPMISAGYLTIAGAAPGEGAILTRNATGTDTDILRLKDGRPADKPWYLIQTNYDHWTQAPARDDRRDNGIKSMEAVGSSKVSLDTLWDVMSTTGEGTGTRGVYNGETISTQMVIPATGEYHPYMGHTLGFMPLAGLGFIEGFLSPNSADTDTCIIGAVPLMSQASSDLKIGIGDIKEGIKDKNLIDIFTGFESLFNMTKELAAAMKTCGAIEADAKGVLKVLHGFHSFKDVLDHINADFGADSQGEIAAQLEIMTQKFERKQYEAFGKHAGEFLHRLFVGPEAMKHKLSVGGSSVPSWLPLAGLGFVEGFLSQKSADTDTCLLGALTPISDVQTGIADIKKGIKAYKAGISDLQDLEDGFGLLIQSFKKDIPAAMKACGAMEADLKAVFKVLKGFHSLKDVVEHMKADFGADSQGQIAAQLEIMTQKFEQKQYEDFGKHAGEFLHRVFVGPESMKSSATVVV